MLALGEPVRWEVKSDTVQFGLKPGVLRISVGVWKYVKWWKLCLHSTQTATNQSVSQINVWNHFHEIWHICSIFLMQALRQKYTTNTSLPKLFIYIWFYLEFQRRTLCYFVAWTNSPSFSFLCVWSVFPSVLGSSLSSLRNLKYEIFNSKCWMFFIINMDEFLYLFLFFTLYYRLYLTSVFTLPEWTFSQACVVTVLDWLFSILWIIHCREIVSWEVLLFMFSM